MKETQFLSNLIPLAPGEYRITEFDPADFRDVTDIFTPQDAVDITLCVLLGASLTIVKPSAVYYTVGHSGRILGCNDFRLYAQFDRVPQIGVKNPTLFAGMCGQFFNPNFRRCLKQTYADGSESHISFTRDDGDISPLLHALALLDDFHEFQIDPPEFRKFHAFRATARFKTGQQNDGRGILSGTPTMGFQGQGTCLNAAITDAAVRGLLARAKRRNLPPYQQVEKVSEQ